MRMKNKFSYKNKRKLESWKRGQNLEDYFYKILLRRDENAQRSSQVEQFKHIDFITKFGTIDVKARKKINRKDKEPQSEIVWLEYRNTIGQTGWLLSEVDIIAFEQDDHFVLVHREDLQKMADKICNIEDMVERAGQALYKGYTRKGWKDLITQVKMKDILKLNHKKWRKE
jgi:hypothetical protein